MKTARIVSVGLVVLLLALAPANAADTPTFSDEVVRIFQRQCQTCHRPGGIAPFSLTTYEDAYKARDEIRDAVRARQMPPWKPVHGFGEFQHVRRLTAAEMATIDRWVETGAPEGDTKKLPAPLEFSDAWTVGEPDVVLTMPRYALEAAEGDVYRCFVMPTSFKEDRYVSAVEFLPGNRKMVHHVLTYLDTTSASVMLEKTAIGAGYPCFGGPGFQPAGGLGGWAPGAPPTVMTPGVGMLLPAGARVVVQVHYNNHGKEALSDPGTRMGIRFARETIDKRSRAVPVVNRTFLIPAGAKRHEVTASWTVPPYADLHAVAVSPHMHLLGREMKVTATYPDGTVRPLIHIDDWDFHWQGSYLFANPIPLPSGTRIDMTAIFDNSPESPRQPNRPPKDLTWGEGTTDEMAIVFVRFTADREKLGWRPPASVK